MNREKWEFEYTASTLAAAAEKQMGIRVAKVTWWNKQRDQVMTEIRASGIEVTESLAMAYAATSADFGPQVSVRHDLQVKLTECHNKIKKHQTAAEAYDAWIQVLSANPESRLKLNHDDWLYFFGE